MFGETETRSMLRAAEPEGATLPGGTTCLRGDRGSAEAGA